MLSRLGCQFSEDHTFLGFLGNAFIREDTTSRDHTIIFLFAGLYVSNFINGRTGFNFTNRRRRGPWRKPLKLSYCAHWYYIELLSKHEHCVWCNNCPWLLEHMDTQHSILGSGT